MDTSILFWKCQKKCSCLELKCLCPAVYLAILQNLGTTASTFFNENSSGAKLEHISTVLLQSQTIHVIEVTDLLELCVFISFHDNLAKGYVIQCPNLVECD